MSELEEEVEALNRERGAAWEEFRVCPHGCCISNTTTSRRFGVISSRGKGARVVAPAGTGAEPLLLAVLGDLTSALLFAERMDQAAGRWQTRREGRR